MRIICNGFAVLDSSLAPSSDKETDSDSLLVDAQETPKNIEIVYVKKCKKGLMFGLVDGLNTAMKTEGIYIRFLVKEDTLQKVN